MKTKPAAPLRNGPCAYAMELEATRRANEAPTLFDDFEEVRWTQPLTAETPPPPTSLGCQ